MLPDQVKAVYGVVAICRHYQAIWLRDLSDGQLCSSCYECCAPQGHSGVSQSLFISRRQQHRTLHTETASQVT